MPDESQRQPETTHDGDPPPVILDYATPSRNSNLSRRFARLFYIGIGSVTVIAFFVIHEPNVLALGVTLCGIIYVMARASEDESFSERESVIAAVAAVACILGVFIIIAALYSITIASLAEWVDNFTYFYRFCVNGDFAGNFADDFLAFKAGITFLVSGVAAFTWISIRAHPRRQKKSIAMESPHKDRGIRVPE